MKFYEEVICAFTKKKIPLNHTSEQTGKLPKEGQFSNV